MTSMRSAAAGVRPRWGTQGLLGLAALLVVLAAVAPEAVAADLGGPGGLGLSGAFGISPAPDSQGQAPAYFKLSVTPGHSVAATAVVSNLASRPETLTIGRAVGVTATNGGSAYQTQSRGCSGPSCWVTGLPSRVSLPAQSRELLNFTVTVPAGTAPGQYLSGIFIELAATPSRAQAASQGTAAARAFIVEQVTVGVAVNVGELSAMVTRLRIPTVKGTLIGDYGRLNIRLDNTGQTFAKGTGSASCTAAGRRRSYPVLADTILPHGNALIAVNLPGIPQGTAVPCTISLRYGKDETARWAGTVTIPALPATRTFHTGNGAYSQIPVSGIPAWGITLIVIGVLLLAGVVFLIYRGYRYRRQ